MGTDDVSVWATGDDIHKRLSTGRPFDTVVGVHIGEGVHWNEKGHMFCIAESGQDKSVNLLLPALLSEGLMEIGASVIVDFLNLAGPPNEKKGWDDLPLKFLICMASIH